GHFMSMAWVGGGIAVAGIAGSVYGADKASEATGDASKMSLQAAREAEKLNKARYAEAKGMLSPYMESEGAARSQLDIEMGLAPGAAGTSYMSSPAYDAARGAGISAVNQGTANTGSLYSGARGEALRDVGQGVQQQFYTNYMNMLQNMATPSATGSVASLGMGQAATIGGQNIAAQNTASNYQMQGVAAQNAANADLFGGIANIGSAYMNYNRPTPAAPAPAAPAPQMTWT
ncbi:unnamed protein product, partial [marine sediment metagenome]